MKCGCLIFFTWINTIVFVFLTSIGAAQSFYFGADLSYVNEMEDCGAIYKVEGEAQDPYAIFGDQGCNLVRLRTWHTPSWYDELNDGQRYSDYEDVRLSIQRAKAEGMHVLLDFHLSDTWADPGNQVVPEAWAAVVDDLPILQDSLYQYIYQTLQQLAEQNLLPEMVQIGNETNKGILLSQEVNDQGWSLDWNRNSALFNSAIVAVRDIETAYQADIKIALHVADPDDAEWLMDGFWDHNVRDFDIIGISYYYQFHPMLFDEVGNAISDLKNTYPGKEVMIFETAYKWTNGNADGANNILGTNYPGYSPPSPAQQKQWMIDMTQMVIDHAGKGVIYWEPAWVSTSCSTQWAQGSHWDNATFFDFNDELLISGGTGWMSHPYDFTSSTENPSNPFEETELYFANGDIIIENLNTSLFEYPISFSLSSLEGKIISFQNFYTLSKDNSIRIKGITLMPGCYPVMLSDAKNKSIAKLLLFY